MTRQAAHPTEARGSGPVPPGNGVTLLLRGADGILRPGTATAEWNAYVAELSKVPKRLADGSLGYFARHPRTDDCFAAALATVLQVPIDQVPDPRIDQRLAAGEAPEHVARSFWQELYRWLDAQGLRLTVHRKLPAPRRRWIGVVAQPGDFQDHCLAMTHDEILFDPTRILDHTHGGRQIRWWKTDDVTYGLSFTEIHRNEHTKP